LSCEVAAYAIPVVLTRIAVVPVVQKPPVISVHRNIEIFQCLKFGTARICLAATLFDKAPSPDVPPIFVIRFNFLEIYDILRL